MITFKKSRDFLHCYLFPECLQCDYFTELHTSRTIGKGFDINKRTVYTIKALGHGHAVIEKFTALMNMPKPRTQNNYDKSVNTISSAMKLVVGETIKDATEGIRQNGNEENDTIVNTGVFCDGSWVETSVRFLHCTKFEVTCARFFQKNA